MFGLLIKRFESARNPLLSVLPGVRDGWAVMVVWAVPLDIQGNLIWSEVPDAGQVEMERLEMEGERDRSGA